MMNDSRVFKPDQYNRKSIAVRYRKGEKIMILLKKILKL